MKFLLFLQSVNQNMMSSYHQAGVGGGSGGPGHNSHPSLSTGVPGHSTSPPSLTNHSTGTSSPKSSSGGSAHNNNNTLPGLPPPPPLLTPGSTAAAAAAAAANHHQAAAMDYATGNGQQPINAKIQQNQDHSGVGSDVSAAPDPDVEGTDLSGQPPPPPPDPDATAEHHISSWKYHQSFQVL